MKAPEKLYLFENPIDNTPDCRWLSKRSCDDDIEYTRTDAFIEKACVKLKKLMYDNLMFQGRLHREEVINNFVEDFKKAMEGE
jgi:hypothetical protein